MKRLSLSLPLISCLSLAACGGGGGSSQPQNPTYGAAAGHLGDGRGEFALNAAGDRIKIDVGATTATLDAGSAAPVGSFVGGYTTDDGSIIAFVSETEASRATLANYPNGSERGTTAQFERLGKTEAPSSGTASLSGDYVGLLTYENGAFAGRIMGDASVTANFNDQTVRGRISDRVYASAVNGTPFNTVQMEDVVLDRADINSAGRFAGELSGGDWSVNGTAASVEGGTFKGLIAGESGDEIVGAIRLDSTYSNNNFSEYGVFAAGH